MMKSDREEILLIGDPRLRKRCDPVSDFEDARFLDTGRRLTRALDQFRSEHGFGRALAAPQIGISSRTIVMNLGKGPFLVVNPTVSRVSEACFTLWDDCMSFPWLMVRVRRHLQIDLSYQDVKGNSQSWRNVDQAVSELLQHEVDHLDGILAIDRALDRESVIARRVYEERRDFFDRLVDYTIRPTIG